MDHAKTERLLDLLEVRLDAFAMCEIENGCSLVCEPSDLLVTHYVLRGEGSISWQGGTLALQPGMIVVIPPRLAKQIHGAGPTLRSVAGDVACPLASGLVRFRASATGRADLVLGCASVEAVMRDGPGLFDHLQQPFAEGCSDQQARPLFAAILAELAQPGLGTRTMVCTMMKQVMILLLRAHFERLGASSPLSMTLAHPRLSHALLAILENPQNAHTLDSLAAAAGMSRSRFVHHFGSAYGRTPMEFVQLARLRAAARMLRASRLPVKTVAATVGYASRSHFSRAFRTEFGSDPTAYRLKG